MSAQRNTPARPATGILALAVALASGACTATPIHLGVNQPQGTGQTATIRSQPSALTVTADTITLTLRVETHDGQVRLVRSPRIEDGAIKGYEERVNDRRQVWRPSIEIALEDVADTRAIETRVEYRTIPVERSTDEKVAQLGGFLGFLGGIFLGMTYVAVTAMGG